jgi:hypothetical protein
MGLPTGDQAPMLGYVPSVLVARGDGSGLRRCSHVMGGVEQHLPLQQDAGDPKQPVGDTA